MQNILRRGLFQRSPWSLQSSKASQTSGGNLYMSIMRRFSTQGQQNIETIIEEDAAARSSTPLTPRAKFDLAIKSYALETEYPVFPLGRVFIQVPDAKYKVRLSSLRELYSSLLDLSLFSYICYSSCYQKEL